MDTQLSISKPVIVKIVVSKILIFICHISSGLLNSTLGYNHLSMTRQVAAQSLTDDWNPAFRVAKPDEKGIMKPQLPFPPYLVKCFFLKNQGFFIVYSQMNEPRKWIFLSIWYKNSGIRVYEIKRLWFSFYMALCMPFPLRRRTSRVYQNHLTFPEGPNFLRSAYP